MSRDKMAAVINNTFRTSGNRFMAGTLQHWFALFILTLDETLLRFLIY